MRNRILLSVLTVLLCWIGYLASQKPKISVNRQHAKLMLLKGGYRAWTLTFCDGETIIDGRWQSVVITTNGVRAGYYRWPRYSHVDVRKMKLD